MSKRGSGSSARAGGGGGAAAKEKELLLLEKTVCGHTMIRRKNPEKSGCFLSIVPKL